MKYLINFIWSILYGLTLILLFEAPIWAGILAAWIFMWTRKTGGWR